MLVPVLPRICRGSLLVLTCLASTSCSQQPIEATAPKAQRNTVAAANGPALAAAPVVSAAPRAGARPSSACARLLDAYEKMAGTYAAVAARVAQFPTDRNVMTEYSVTATHLVSLQEAAQKHKENGCESDSAFMRRYTRIAAAISEVASAHAAGPEKAPKPSTD